MTARSTATIVEFPSQGEVVVREDAVPGDELGPLEVVLRAEASIISSGTELANLHNFTGEASYPLRPGYGMIGVIEAVGGEVDDFAVGDRVFCAGKHASLQRFKHRQGHQWGHLFPVPADLDPVDACVGCMAQIAYTAPALTDLELGDTVAVFGLGLVGILAARLYQLRGARVLGVDPVAHRCELAQRFGIAETCAVAPQDQTAAVREWSGGDGVAVACDATGMSPAVANAIHATRLLGQAVLLGSPRQAWESNTTELLSKIHMDGLVVRGAHMWHFPMRMDRGVGTTVENNFRIVFELIRSGRLDVRRLISHVISPAQAPEAYLGLREDTATWTGAVIDWR